MMSSCSWVQEDEASVARMRHSFFFFSWLTGEVFAVSHAQHRGLCDSAVYRYFVAKGSTIDIALKPSCSLL